MFLDRLRLQYNDDIIKSLQNKTVLVLGLGGVGSYVVEVLARSGINLILVDYDKIDVTNINRQLLALNSTIGQYKVKVLEDRVRDINPDCIIKSINEKITIDNINILLENKIDYIVDACDTVQVKMELIKLASSNNIPLISCMGMGNRFDPKLIEIVNVNKTYNDPLAKKIRKYVKENNINNKVMVCFSKELPIKIKNNIISSNAFVPSTAGILIGSYVIKELVGSING